jgi:hypothetical protein
MCPTSSTSGMVPWRRFGFFAPIARF